MLSGHTILLRFRISFYNPCLLWYLMSYFFLSSHCIKTCRSIMSSMNVMNFDGSLFSASCKFINMSVQGLFELSQRCIQLFYIHIPIMLKYMMIVFLAHLVLYETKRTRTQTSQFIKYYNFPICGKICFIFHRRHNFK